MTGKVLAFPKREQPDEPVEPLDPVSYFVVGETGEQDPVSFLDWVYIEVPHFQQWAADLDTVAEQSEEDFWALAQRLREQINGWFRDAPVQT